ncbi:LysE family translocator [Candidatus Pelagibacter sp. Uisw_136]|jgi:threonine/homoserine/homoserine lactone efflux protein|uniref:LysE family translocator n=1 Tax=Candidatus Pelagibacter sp. Uisw_136 TaxID=3230991 RepID=UPI00014D21DA|nr:LysE family translocator [Candidatus Pelagibacter sp.]MDA9065765.1 LysE family translocator [Candidatus Pelagibacter sp.]MDB9956690.1 LysE family translocator [Candidatus Pelagibacter sp.]MDC0126582.1 LysE family translocator [Candidatus Pelagibacter sp.]MDC1246120.1 LysE family translocator [Pelagibacteraceae bacterium]|tara:strand:- start:156 stop:746 length:591 start_codon:yes stop_codon:yes gene_type:complete
MHPELLLLIGISLSLGFTPGPNNAVAAYSGFNFGIRKTLPLILGVGFGYTTLIILINFVLISTFKNYPIIQEIIRVLGTIFLIYLAYKISFSKISSDGKTENPVKFFDKFIFQFINPKGVMAGITLSSNFVEQGENYLNHSIWVIVVCSVTAFLSITSWTFLGKFLRKFATNNNFIKRFNYAMSLLLIVCIIGFYI